MMELAAEVMTSYVRNSQPKNMGYKLEFIEVLRMVLEEKFRHPTVIRSTHKEYQKR